MNKGLLAHAACAANQAIKFRYFCRTYYFPMDEDFRLQVLRFFKSGMLSSGDKLAGILFEKFIVGSNAKKIAAQYASINSRTTADGKIDIAINRYKGGNLVALKIRDHLEAAAGSNLIGAYLHGSIATSEVIGYSDFDGLVIVKSECMKNPQKLAGLFTALKETEMMMLDMDPLQHHGWFVLTEADLVEYPEHYFPTVLFNHAATLFGESTLTMQLNPAGYTDYFVPSFNHLSQSILSKLETGSYLQNYYAFKNLLSEFMLLPAIYLQAKTGKGVFKKYSFSLLDKELGADYSIMNVISGLREKWNYKPPPGYLKLRKRGKLSKNFAARSGQLPEETLSAFRNELGQSMKKFVNQLQSRIQK